MTKAEEKAQDYSHRLDYYHYTSDDPSVAYKAGYEQAEKDLALTWGDIRRIVVIADELVNEWGTEKMHNDGQEAYYTEVLKRFKEEEK